MSMDERVFACACARVDHKYDVICPPRLRGEDELERDAVLLPLQRPRCRVLFLLLFAGVTEARR